MKISYSALRIFMTCPHAYYHTYIACDIPERPAPPAIERGTNIHKAINDYHKGIIDENYLQYLRIVKKFDEMYKHCSSELKFECEYDSVTLVGIIDDIYYNQKHDRYLIIDYKTGAISEDMHGLQLSLYSIYADSVYKHCDYLLVYLDHNRVIKIDPDLYMPTLNKIIKAIRSMDGYSHNEYPRKTGFYCSSCPLFSECYHPKQLKVNKD